jgi:Cdc6-like AAA superfamily ATPase
MVSLADMHKKKSTSTVYVGMDFNVIPSRHKISKSENVPQKPLMKVINGGNHHLAILGQPGAGKTTTMKFLCSNLLTGKKLGENYNFPIVIRLRELNGKSKFNLFSELLSILNVKIETKNKEVSLNVKGNELKLEQTKEEYDYYEERLTVVAFLEELKPLIILDGLDEISSASRKNDFLNHFEQLTKSLTKARVILTSRTAEYLFVLDNVETYEICGLNDAQINSFAKKWLRGKSTSFLEELKKTPFYDAAVKPLTIANLCAIYERTGRIPEKPKSVYKLIMRLLLEDWDDQRRITRLSKYNEFESDRKEEFLSRLSYELSRTTQNSYFSRDMISKIYKTICEDFGLEKSDFKSVVNEIESHSGLFLQVNADAYEFSHKSIQEYLTADHIVKLPEFINDLDYLSSIPNELAIAVGISSNQSEYFCMLVSKFFEHFLSDDKITLKNKGANRKRVERNLLVHELKMKKIQFMMNFVNRILLEKPDFNSNSEVCLTFIYLYTLYYGNCVYSDSDGQLDMFGIDSILSQFVKFAERVIQRNKDENLYKDFKVKEKVFGEEVYILENINSKGFNNYLFAPKEFLKTFEIELI